jgi:hypothetical protein
VERRGEADAAPKKIEAAARKKERIMRRIRKLGREIKIEVKRN